MRGAWSTRALVALLLPLGGVMLLGCPPTDTPPAFPADYASRYVEVRNCRRSPEHDLAFIRVLASPEAAAIYEARAGTFPEDTVILKEEFADPGCTDLDGFAVMRREGADWRWQSVTPERRVLEDGALPRCAGCHATCDMGFEDTCTLP